MRDFQFHRPATVAAAIALLQTASQGKLLAGGQSLLPVLKLEMAEPSDLISINHLPELHGIQVTATHVVIGAATRHAQVASAPEIRRAIPGLAHLAEGIGDPQVRNRGTLGGSLAHADPAADYPAAILALGATIVTDRREIAADAFFTGLFETCLAADEIITAVRFPIPKRAAYAKFASHASKYALVGVMVAKGPQGVRVAVTGAGASAFRLPAVEAALQAHFHPAALADLLISAEDLQSTAEASAEYRAQLVKVMAGRAVHAALAG